jgi:hypothetical protein
MYLWTTNSEAADREIDAETKLWLGEMIVLINSRW